jgi:hypothetical protein
LVKLFLLKKSFLKCCGKKSATSCCWCSQILKWTLNPKDREKENVPGICCGRNLQLHWFSEFKRKKVSRFLLWQESAACWWSYSLEKSLLWQQIRSLMLVIVRC